MTVWNKSLRVDSAFISLTFPGLGSAVGSQQCELLNSCVLKEKLPNFSFDEDIGAGGQWVWRLSSFH